MTVIFWAVTPLQGAILVSRFHTKSTSVNVQSFSPLVPPAAQTTGLTSSFLSAAFGVTWLGEGLPGFTTRENSVMPFDLGDSHKNDFTTWIAPTTLYSTEFTCTLASRNIAMGENASIYTFTDQEGCTTAVSEGSLMPGNVTTDKHILQYYLFSHFPIPSYRPYRRAFFLDCPTRPEPTALIIWGEIHNVASTSLGTNVTFANATASFCQANYFSQDATVTVSSSNASVLDIVPGTTKKSLSVSEFDPVNFEITIDWGGPQNGTSQVTGDLPNQAQIQTFQQIPLGISQNAADPVAFALQQTNLSIRDLSTPESVQGSFGDARKLLFAFAMNELSGPPQQDLRGTKAEINTTISSVVIARVFAVLVEGFLCLILTCSVALYLLSRKRKNLLVKDPSSIKDIMELFPNEKSMLDDFSRLSDANARTLEQNLLGKRYRLRQCFQGRPIGDQPLITEYQRTQQTLSAPSSQPKRRPPTGFRSEDSVLPFQLTWTLGLPFIAAIFTSISALMVLYRLAQISNGE